MANRIYLNRKVVKSKGGKRVDLDGLYCRSAMEADFYRILAWLHNRTAIIAWAPEPCVFGFTDFGHKRGPWAYTPDAVVWWAENELGLQNVLPGARPEPWTEEPMNWFVGNGAGSIVRDVAAPKPEAPKAMGRMEYFEVKGREVSADRSKMKRLKKHYPKVSITVVGAEEWKDLGAFFGPRILNWETRFRKGIR